MAVNNAINNILYGVTNGAAAAAGQIGEVISSVITSGTAVALTNATGANVTSIVLTAGQWLISGEVWLTTNPTTQGSLQICSINTVSATYSAQPAVGTAYSELTANWTGGTTGTPVIPLSPVNVNISVPTTYYLVNYLVFSVSTANAFGKLVGTRIR